MKVHVIGTSSTWYDDLCTNYAVDDSILVEVPQGNYKTIKNVINLNNNLKYIIISHFHNDCFTDLVLIADYLRHFGKNIVHVFAPRGAKRKLYALLRVHDLGHVIKDVKKAFVFHTITNGSVFNFDNYEAKFYRMEHANLNAYGFTLTNKKENVTVGFSGDTTLCPNLELIIENSTYCFVDCGDAASSSSKHLSVTEFIGLTEKHPNKQFFPVHLSPVAKQELIQNKIKVVNDNTKIVVKRKD